MIVGCYTLDLYCDNDACVRPRYSEARPDVYTGRTYSACKRSAVHDGWRFGPRRQWAVCPECVAAKVKPKLGDE